MKTNKELIANKICTMFDSDYEICQVLEENHWARQAGLPHITLTKKDNKESVFYLEITEPGNMSLNCLKLKNLQDKKLPFYPAFYVVVPKEQLQYSKCVASVIGLNARFGTYTVTNDFVEVILE